MMATEFIAALAPQPNGTSTRRDATRRLGREPRARIVS